MACFLSNFYQKRLHNLYQKVNQQQNTVCLEQQIYAIQKNFRPTLLVMLLLLGLNWKNMKQDGLFMQIQFPFKILLVAWENNNFTDLEQCSLETT